jgi:hypothetical protein
LGPLFIFEPALRTLVSRRRTMRYNNFNQR